MINILATDKLKKDIEQIYYDENNLYKNKKKSKLKIIIFVI